MEAEFIAGNEAAKEAAWLEKLVKDLGETETVTVPVLRIDNQGAIDLIHDHRFHAKAKHIDIRLNFIRNDMVENNRLLVEHILGSEQPADALTKALPAEAFRRHLWTMGMRSLGAID